jgi:hypothetical protein
LPAEQVAPYTFERSLDIATRLDICRPGVEIALIASGARRSHEDVRVEKAPTPFAVSDGRRAELTNSAFGAVYGVVEGTAYPVCDTAGYAPFGFGYRHCAAERITTEFTALLLS